MCDESVGLQRGKAKVVDYDPRWVRVFEKERERLVPIFGDELVGLQHVGSTAVPGLSAKPIIDIAVAVDSFEKMDRWKEELGKLGYEYKGEQGVPGRHFLPKGPESRRTHHLNIVLPDNEQWKKWITFRDVLRESKELVQEYGELKTKLADEYAEDRKEYTKRKNEFITRHT